MQHIANLTSWAQKVVVCQAMQLLIGGMTTLHLNLLGQFNLRLCNCTLWPEHCHHWLQSLKICLIVKE